MKTPPRRWEPDPHLVDAVLVTGRSSVPLTRLSQQDRAWLVSGLTLAGLTADQIANRTGCSIRLVKAVRADPATMVATAARVEAAGLERELRAERCARAVLARRVSELGRELKRVRSQRDQLIGGVR